LDCVPHPGQEVGCRLSTVTVQACSPRWTLTTFRLGVGDHETDVFITLAAAYRRKMPARQGVIGRVAPRACTKSKSDPTKMAPDTRTTDFEEVPFALKLPSLTA
jgi:hypothetical protein